VVALTLVALNVLLAAEAAAGMEAREIAEERMKAMRRMGKPRLVWWVALEPSRAELGAERSILPIDVLD
jgi:hypothetical protein